MLKSIFATILCFAIFANIAQAAEKPRVVVMDLGARHSSEISSENIGAMASDYLLEALWSTNRFAVMDWENAEEEIITSKLPTSGLIPPSAAREIAKLLNADYIIYGNISSVDSKDLVFEIAGNGGNFRSIKSALIVRMMDVKTGEILVVAKGKGASKSSEIRGGAKNLAYVTIGTKKVPSICVHNAIKKATFAAAEEIVAEFFNEPLKKK